MYQKYIKNVRKKNKSPKNIFKKKKKENRKINIITYI
jgi:phage terminase large subunit-like protein